MQLNTVTIMENQFHNFDAMDITQWTLAEQSSMQKSSQNVTILKQYFFSNLLEMSKINAAYNNLLKNKKALR